MKLPEIPNKHAFLESLEPRIAPAALVGVEYKAITFGEQYLSAGQGLSTSQGGTGSLVLAVEKGEALVFTTDLNGNNRFDPNEITGVAAGDGLRLTSFVDINGDVVTNLMPNTKGQLSDSDGDATNGRDGKLLLNSRIENITLRSVTQADLPPEVPVSSRIALSSYSIHGFIYAGGGIGTSTSAGVVVDTSGLSDQIAKFSGGDVDRQTDDVVPNIGGIATGTAASGAVYSFGFKTTGVDAGAQPTGYGGALAQFRPSIGQTGGDVIGLKVGGNVVPPPSAENPDPSASYTPAAYTIGFILTGDGGIGARGGNIQDVALMGDIGGLRIVAGRGGDGVAGGAGGSIVNLTDLGSYNSVVEIRAGDGGEGFLGKAGAAGNINFGPTMSTNGQMAIGLGSGGIGLTQGGAGTSLLSGTMTPSNGTGSFAVPVEVLSTWRPDDAISPVTADVNADGFADALLLTREPNELALVFGGPLGITDSSPRLFFDAPAYVSNDTDGRSSGVVLADFDGNGLLDVATASSRENSSDGLRVFLNDGTWYGKASLSADSGNYVHTYVHNPLPYLPFLLSTGSYTEHRRGFPVTDLVSGDFNDDGVTDLAYLMQGLRIAVPNPNTTNLVVMEGLGDGRFFVDFQYDRATDKDLNVPFSTIYSGPQGWDPVELQSSVVEQGDAGTSRLVTARSEDNKLLISAYTDVPLPVPSQALVVETVGAGKYQESWPDPDPNAAPPSTADAAILGFTILDLNDGVKDGFWDVAAINQNNALTLFAYDPASDALLSRPPLSGIALTGERTLYGPDNTPEFFAITTGDFDGDPTTSEVALLGDDPEPAGWSFRIIGITGVAIADNTPLRLAALGTELAIAPEQAEYAPFDVTPNVLTGDGFIVAGRNSTAIRPYALTPADILSLNNNTLDFAAGDGGNSRLGNGGAGGGLGQGSLFETVDDQGQISQSGSFNFVQPASRFSQVVSAFGGGSGGDGFVNGGRGGAISGFRSSFDKDADVLAATVSLYGGGGGSALEGIGGQGGTLANFYTEYGANFIGGLGGTATTGGNGGSVRPNTPDLQSTGVTTYLTVQAGDGGNGISQAGNGGIIDRFFAEYRKPTAGEGGSLVYLTGNGGDSVAGVGGTGGSVTKSSPYEAGNYLIGPISIIAGNGGDGLTGGAGGLVGAFVNKSTAFSTVTLLNILAGNGGTGVVGNGGRGGSISDFTASAVGIDTLDPVTLEPALIGYTYQYNRIIAGAGGESYGAKGGVGGSLVNISTAANSSAMAVAAGDGGAGLSVGGAGGSVTNVVADSSAAEDTAKVIVFAGNGGNAYAALASSSNVAPATTSDGIKNLRAFGGTAGVAGNGGSIVNFTQPKTVGASVDLVAGNGGSLKNYGSPADAKTNAGIGGSIQNVSLAGEAGRVTNASGQIAKDIPIKSYGSDFVQNTLRDTPTAQLTSATGNVGVVVGEAGRVRGGLAAGDGTAKVGSVSSFTAKNIMSMVAGSVDRIAQFRVAGSIVATGGIYGAFKDLPVSHLENSPLYYAVDGVTTIPTPTTGGKLMDGAIYTLTKPAGLQGERVF